MLAELRVEHARATSETHLLATEALSDTPPTPDPPFPDPWGPAIAAVEFVLILSLNCREPGDGNTKKIPKRKPPPSRDARRDFTPTNAK